MRQCQERGAIDEYFSHGARNDPEDIRVSKNTSLSYVKSTDGEISWKSRVGKYGWLKRHYPHGRKKDGAINKLTTVSRRARFLCAHHYSLLDGNPGTKTLRLDYYWPHMATYSYREKCKWKSCAPNSGTQQTHRTLEFISMELSVPLPKTNNVNQPVLVLPDRYYKRKGKYL